LMSNKPMGPSTGLAPEVDVLVVGAGPTGLTLACQLARFGVRFRIIDKQPDRAHESRALGVQARSLEVLQALGLGEALATRGQTTTRLMLHVDRDAPVAIDLGAIPRADTRFPYILFVSQSDTEAVLGGYLEAADAHVERRVELVGFREESAGIVCVLRHVDGREETIHASYLAGCDGAHSTVRKEAGIAFEGGAYPQTFALGDVEADGALVPEAINAFALGRGVAIFFPLGHPATWRVMAMEGTAPRPLLGGDDTVSTQQLTLAELQAMVDDPTGRAVRVHDPVWLTRFRLHHRQAATYRRGRVFLAGDAAHIHSPVGAQGMNTGIQDAWNLGWKLALVTRGTADPRLLDSYHAERWPVGRTLLRATDRVFGVFARAVASQPSVTSLRRVMVRRVVAPALSSPRVRAFAFHFVSQLGIRYRKSPVVTDGEPALSKGPRPGDRMPDAHVIRDERPAYLQQALSSPHVHLLLCGPVAAWNRVDVLNLTQRFPDVVAITYLTREHSAEALVDASGEALTRLGVDRHATYVIRPDGHVAFRSGGTDLRGPAAYLARWFTAARKTLE
jgi:2-polyprenyl-6-methoxyphenol hydroxylase-like FAD-dependent oxidoreductase